MAVEFEPLVFEIKQGSNDAAKGVDELTESLKKLKSATSNLSALNQTASSLKNATPIVVLPTSMHKFIFPSATIPFGYRAI